MQSKKSNTIRFFIYLSINCAHYLQDIHENVANVQVELESGVDVVLFGVLVAFATDDHLSVDGQEYCHNDGTKSTVDGLENVVAHEYARDAESDERKRETYCD